MAWLRGWFVALLLLWPSLLLAQTTAGSGLNSNSLIADELLSRAKAVLSPLDGDFKLNALRQPVEVLRDRWGIPHIYAQNTHDLFFAQGFVVAQDRLFQIDLWRRVGLGELAEIYGESSLAGDRFARLVKYRGEMAAEWSSYSNDTQEIATAFTAGINAWIDQCQDKLPIEFQLLGPINPICLLNRLIQRTPVVTKWATSGRTCASFETPSTSKVASNLKPLSCVSRVTVL